MRAIKVMRILVVLLVFLAPFRVSANGMVNPQFSDFIVEVSNGPFAKKIVLSKTQEGYSNFWKLEIDNQLKKPINFSGHYILYTSYGGHGAECKSEGWVCGWLIDKLTGKIVSELPKDDNGSSVYASLSDNGTPIGLPFEVDSYKDSSMIAIIGQSIPISNPEDDTSVCKSVIFNFTGVKFVKLMEALDGCNFGD